MSNGNLAEKLATGIGLMRSFILASPKRFLVFSAYDILDSSLASINPHLRTKSEGSSPQIGRRPRKGRELSSPSWVKDKGQVCFLNK